MANKVLIRGGGDLASAVARRAFLAGMDVLILELPEPKVVRRTVSFASAVYQGEMVVEDVPGKLHQKLPTKSNGHVSVLVDPEGKTLSAWKPDVLVDARMTKRPCVDTAISQANLVIGLGPGFEAGENCHAVVETKRGHNLGRVLWNGLAAAYSGVPGEVGGRASERVLRAPGSGIFSPRAEIGALLQENELVALVDGQKILAPFSGTLRGCLYQGSFVTKGQKVADLDPRKNTGYCHQVSDKANAVAGGVMEAILNKKYRRKS